MKAAVIYENGSPSALRYEAVPDPTPGPGEVLVRAQAISIEGGDLLLRAMIPLPYTPFVIGYQTGGEVVAVGAAVTEYKVGDRVTGFNVAQGSHAELQVMPVESTYSVPDGLDMLQAAAVPVAFGTAHNCVFERGALQPGETVLVQGGASGVGVAAIQLAKRAGARVIATASSEEKLERLKPLGVDHGVNYRTEDVPARIMALTEGRGVDLIVDPVGGTVTQGSLACLGYGGRLCWVGLVSREPTVLGMMPFVRNNKSLHAVYFEGATDSGHAMVQRLINEVARGELKVVIDKVFPLSEAAAAHAYIESRQSLGRVMMTP